jgi:hypothetical protein
LNSRLLVVTCFVSGCLFAQGLQTTASKTDWEEINFEFNSSVLSDGYPSLLRLAELLSQHQDYRVKVVGNTDYVGSNPYNDKLSIARANAVKEFLVKYGASAGQITTSGEGKRDPEVDNKTQEGRFMNRRVQLTVTDGQGKVVGEGSVGAAIHSFEEAPKKQVECCEAILKRLDMLDTILSAVRGLRGENDRLKSELADLRNEQNAMRDQVAGVAKQLSGAAKPLSREQVVEIAANEGDRVLEESANRNKKFSLLGLNIGPTTGKGKTGDFSFSGRGQFFSPFGGSGMNAVQAQGEYMYYPGRQEGQFDIGLIHRWDRVQAGMFSSFKYLNFREHQQGGGLGQGALTIDYLFSRGRIGMFGTKGFKSTAVLNRAQLGPTSWTETYARIVDQIGGSAQVGAWGNAYFEGNLGYLKRHGAESDRPGGMVRLVQPLSNHLAFTIEGGLNETLVSANDSGRIVLGLQFGHWVQPKEYLQVKHPVPVDIPRIRYELLTRRIGNSSPVADAGPDQVGVRAGTITLDGSASSDPDGDPLTYQWTQIGGVNVAISGVTTAKATFTAAEGQTYNFRLTVKDPGGLQASARVMVTTAKTPEIRIVRFSANPEQITLGGTSTLEWSVENAEQITIAPVVGSVRPAGSTGVSPRETTEYVLTARGASGESRATVTVRVVPPGPTDPRIIRFEATPTNIAPGESSTLSWTTEGASEVRISGLGTVDANGSRAVTPAQTTTYVLTARGSDGREVSAPLIVTVGGSRLPRIIRFAGSPTEVGPGEAVSLCWQVENATGASLSPGSISSTDFSNCTTVNPQDTTTYTLAATNANGRVTAVVVISVAPQVKILTFTVNPQVSKTAGAAVTLSWTTQNATSVVVTGNGVPSGSPPVNGSMVVSPAADTTYTLIAYGKRSQVSAVLLVRVGGGTGSGGPIADAGPDQTVSAPFTNLDGSNSKDPMGGPLKFSWRVAGLKPADFIQGLDTAKPRVRLNGGYGEYIFELTVTDQNGQRATDTTKVDFVDP